MRAPGFTETMQALRDGTLAVLLGGLLTACSAADAGPMPTDGDEMGGAYVITPASPEATGGAAGSTIAATGGAGADGIGAGGESYDTGGAAGAGVDDVGAGGMLGEGTGGFDTGGTLGEGTGGIGAGGMEGTGTVVNNQVVCNPIASGTSTVVVNGVARTFSVQMPANTSHMALLFLWHGWMQVPAEFTN